MTNNCSAAADAQSCACSLPVACTYLTIRPTIECGDFTATGSLTEHDAVQIQAGTPNQPPSVLATFDDAESGIGAALGLRAQFSHLSLWYNGAESAAEFSDWRTLARVCAEWDEDWELVERVAMGI